MMLIGDLPEPTMDMVQPLERAVHYAGRDTDLTCRVAGPLEDQIAALDLQVPLALDLGILPMVERMQSTGMLVDIDYLRDLSAVLGSEYAMTVEMIGMAAGKSVNPASGPQVAEWLFDDLHIPWSKKTKSGDRPATDKKILEALSKDWKLASEQREAVELVLEAREIQKLKTTYCDQIGDFVGRDGRLHPKLLLTRTGTGRTASKDPNVLALPKHSKRGKLIRGGFIAAPGRILAEFDLSQAELRMLAIDSGDEAMLQEFRMGIDKHVLTAALHIFKVDPVDLEKRYRADEPKAVEMRFAAKAVNFGIVMGITEHGLVAQFHKNGNLDWTEARCAKLLREWHIAYPGASAYLSGKHAEARRHGYVRNWSGRMRYLEGVNSVDKYAKAESLRQAQATPVQSGARDIMKLWMAEIWRRLPEVREHYWCEAILDIHDAVLLELDEAAFPLVERIMHETLASIQRWAIPVTCDGKRGLNWGAL
jgi:DNA polymerase-1